MRITGRVAPRGEPFWCFESSNKKFQKFLYELVIGLGGGMEEIGFRGMDFLPTYALAYFCFKTQ